MTLDEAVTRALAEAGLPGSRDLVLVLLAQEDDRWRVCCGSNCKPCSTQLAAVIDRIRELARHDGNDSPRSAPPPG